MSIGADAKVVRICLCGDEGTGKSSLITSLVKDTFVAHKIQPTLPPITVPPSISTPEDVSTTIIDTSALPQERNNLNKEIRKSSVIFLVYADHYSYERIALFWLPHFRSLGVNVPVVLCANKSDLSTNVSTEQVIEDEMLPVMSEFKEIDSCIRTSAREHHNINEAFFLCQKAVTDPIAPLYDAKESSLKPACISALKRIFHLCDHDQDGYLSDDEIQQFQNKCFGKPLSPSDLENIKNTVSDATQSTASQKGITSEAFVALNKIFAQKGRHETIWLILRTFHYSNSLSLEPRYFSPKFDVPPNASVELSPAGYRFFVDLFLLHDKDNDGGLSPSELDSLLFPTPGLPTSWSDDSASFPSSTVRNEAHYITLQGWLAQWSMTTFFSPKTTLNYLAFLGFDPPNQNTKSALTITKPRKRTVRSRKRPPKTERSVLFAYLVGSPGAGKSSLLDAFLSRPFSPTYHPSIKQRTAVNTVELPGGKQCTLILSELGELEPAILENSNKLSTADLVVYVYDSSDLDSFSYIPSLRSQHPHLEDMPSLYVALKADMDRCMQSGDVQPDDYTTSLGLGKPLHVSVMWSSIGELFVNIAEAALWPASALPAAKDGDSDDGDWTSWWIAGGAMATVVAAALGVWRRLDR
ncbi:ERMES complex Ca(2+)-binding regulatory GTPase gem1 [Bacidia gigantensis]|uniref:ERMES complex Ca(2+)-binding regulatory GTPase gem1 n=1 Tax=Bacidia gigantensis TaxID=2732470 RepID=UPI001D046DD9|nr:ERMES complex Ca(2+)-binding regulatory GTPase gem1 [Bacidia gigantensis]KAG8532782.1 ERMES complex Ca(2+)-binding regulatory GTPase gem1 [Bacidia gigantensis]